MFHFLDHPILQLQKNPFSRSFLFPIPLISLLFFLFQQTRSQLQNVMPFYIWLAWPETMVWVRDLESLLVSPAAGREKNKMASFPLPTLKISGHIFQICDYFSKLQKMMVGNGKPV